MTPQQLKEAQRQLGLNIKQLAATLNTPYRTLQSWRGGEYPVPGVAGVAVKLLLKEKAREDATNEKND